MRANTATATTTTTTTTTATRITSSIATDAKTEDVKVKI